MLLLGIYPDKTIIRKDTCTPMFTAALFTIFTNIVNIYNSQQPTQMSIDRKNCTCCTYTQWYIQFSSAQSLSPVQLFATPWIAARQASLFITNCWRSHQLPKLTQTHVHRVGDAIQPSHPLSSPSPLAFSLSQHQGLFKWVSIHIRWPKYWSFSFSISPSNEYSGLISFRMDWLDLLAGQGTLKGLLQYHSSLVLSFLYSPTLTSIHHHWKNHSFD